MTAIYLQGLQDCLDRADLGGGGGCLFFEILGCPFISQIHYADECKCRFLHMYVQAYLSAGLVTLYGRG